MFTRDNEDSAAEREIALESTELNELAEDKVNEANSL